jgi:hypothetical protein
MAGCWECSFVYSPLRLSGPSKALYLTQKKRKPDCRELYGVDPLVLIETSKSLREEEEEE